MQIDFHYYATYCAAILAGYTHEESLDICYSAQYVDCCTRTVLSRLDGPSDAATTQLQLELADARTGILSIQDMTRIWASFHFLPADLDALPQKKCTKLYRQKYRMICGPDSALLKDTIALVKGGSLQAAGLAMHVLADTWAHRYFAGIPSLVINNTNYFFYELVPDGDGFKEREVRFRHNPSGQDDPGKGTYTNTPFQTSENSIMSLGHGRAGHLPDYSYARYRYLPAWGDYREIVKDNPADYYKAFCQMIYAMKYLRGLCDTFETGQYDTEEAAPWEQEIRGILEKRQTDSSADWKAFGEKLSGKTIIPFAMDRYEEEYLKAEGEEKEETFLGRFFLAALRQKSMVTNKIFSSGSMLAGISIDFNAKGFAGIKDYRRLLKAAESLRHGGKT